MSSISIPILNLNMTKVFNFLKSIENFDSPSKKPENHSKISCLPVSFIFKFKNFNFLIYFFYIINISYLRIIIYKTLKFSVDPFFIIF